MIPTTIISSLLGTFAMLNQTNPGSAHIWGAAPIGHITYTNQGFMSAVMAATEPEWRPVIGSSKVDHDNPDLQDEWATISKHTLSYAAPYYFDEGSNEQSGVVHHGPIAATSSPQYHNTTFTRYYSLHENGQVLCLRFAATDEVGVWWRRLTPPVTV